MKYYKRYTFIIFVTECVLFLLLLAFLAVWVIFGSPSNIMNQIGLQRARCERIEKDALILQYDTNQQDRSQALSELQDTIPPADKAQQALQTGDTSLRLPRHPPNNVILLVNQSNSDYIPIQVAANKIIANHTPVDPLQTQIIMAHEHSYSISINNIAVAWEDQIDTVFFQLFLIEAGITLVLLVLVIMQYRRAINYYNKPHEE